MNKRKNLTPYLLIVFCPLLFANCPNPFMQGKDSARYNIPEGMGMVSLSVSNGARTIMPSSPPALGDIGFLEIIFTPASADSGTSKTVEVEYNGSSAPEPVLLTPGTYSLTVNAYKGPGKTGLIARGTQNGIEIVEGQNTPVSVTLRALLSQAGASGTFSWNITVPSDVNTQTAKMTVTPLDANGTAEQDIDLTFSGGVSTGSRALNSGLYNVTFNLQKTGGTSLKWRELLHVYASLDSGFTKVFTDAHFSVSHYTVTFVYNDNGATASGSQSVMHGGTIPSGEPHREFVLSAGLYLNPIPTEWQFGGWYTDNGTFNNEWSFDAPVITDITVYAKWSNPGGGEAIVLPGTGANDVEKAIAYVNTPANAAAGAYTLLVGADNATATVENVGPQTISAANFDLTIQGLGTGERNIQYSGAANSSLFTISNAAASLTLGKNITLKGITNGTTSLVRVTSGTLVMKEGSKITGHTYNGTSSTGGGVYISTSGRFTMSGGEISGNIANDGAGVYIDGGIFTMIGGKISGNKPINDNGNGCGVYFKSGIFTVGGTAKIFGNLKENGSASNVNLYGDGDDIMYITIGTGGDSPVTETGGMEIHVSINEWPPRDSIIVNSGATAAIAGCFHADAAGKEVILNGDRLLIAEVKVKVQNGSTTTYYPDLASALSSITGAGTYMVMIYETQTLAPRTLSASNANITLIAGNLSNPVEIQLSANGSLFTVNTNVTLTLDSGVTLKGMSGNTTALVAVNGGRLNMEDGSKITGNSATANSGGVNISNSGRFTMTGGEISGNSVSASSSGGGVNISSSGTTFTMNGGTISGNSVSAGSSGGGVRNSGGTFTMTDGTISDNTVAANTNSGGGVNISSNGTFTMTGGTISNNTATATTSGGGVYLSNGTFTMNGGTISGNTGGGGAGGVYYSGGNGNFTMNEGTISNNEATSGGGGVSVLGGVFNLAGGTIRNNKATTGGGGVNQSFATINMTGGEISGNTASGNNGGGGVRLSHTTGGETKFNMTGGEISGNTASGNNGGGGVLVNGTAASINTNFNMAGGTISGNTASGTNGGGGILLNGATSTVTMTGGIIRDNGGGVNVNNGTFIVGGTAKVSGNTIASGTTPNNVYLANNRYITLGTDADSPASGMNVFVQTASADGVIVESGASANHVQYFHADETGKGVGYRETGGAGQLYISAVDMVSAAGGSFQMGQNGNGNTDNVTPIHTVTLTQGFSMSKYQVTQGQYQTVMTGNNNGITATPSNGHGEEDNYPVYYVSWYDAIVFCNKLSIMEGLTPAYRISNSSNPGDWGTVPTGSANATWDAVEIVAGSNGYRLPTEAQWEYAAKGGALASSPYKIYSGSDTVGDVAWYGEGNTSTHPVGTKAPNELGLYDMSGNVWEWCWDWFYNYPTTSQTDPMGATSDATGNRVVRGGGYRQPENQVRSVSRGGTLGPHQKYDDVGFRVLRPVQ